MRSLSKEAERKLISAIEKAAALVNGGAEPTDAIVKSASEHAIPAGHINLMVHAYNTGATTAQREKGESTLEKAADFKLADAGAVLKALYPETVKSSSAIKRAEAVSTEYALPVSDLLARRRNAMQKAAAAQVALPEKTWTPPPRDEHAAVMRAQSEKVAAARAEEETRRQATVAYSKAAAALEDLNVYFRTPGNMSFGDALREVNVRLGESGVSVLQKVAAVYPHFNKQADTKQHHFGHDRVYDLVQNVLDSVGVYNDAQAKVSVKKSEAVSQKTAPQFLTGSILAEKVEEPLTLKGAMAAGDRHGLRDPARGNQPGAPGLGNKGTEEDPANFPGINLGPDEVLIWPDNFNGPKPRVMNRSDLTSEADIDAAYAAANKPYTGRQRSVGGGSGSSSPPAPPSPPSPPGPDELYLTGDKTYHEDTARLFGLDPDKFDAKGLNAEINKLRSNEKTRDRIEKFRQQVGIETPEEIAAREHDEKLQDALFNESENKRIQQERDMQYARKLDDEDLAAEQAAIEKERADKEEQDKAEKARNKAYAAGGEFAKAFKGDFAGNASAPVKFVGNLLGTANVGADVFKTPDSGKVLKEQYQRLAMDPSHENALKTIRAKSMLHDMVLNDPVISGHDPQDVAMAFNEIAELAPSLIDTPGMIRPLLRKRLESGQLADFDVKQILEMDKLRADRDKAITDTRQMNLNALT